MTVAIIFVLAGVLSLAAALWFARTRTRATVNFSELTRQLQSIDINAFRNLMDPQEEDFLRRHLEASEFRRVQRERFRAAIEYVLLAARNAAVLQRIGDSSRMSSTPSLAAAGIDLASRAVRFRVYAFQVVVRLYLATLTPNPSIRAVRIAECYERINSQAVVVRCLNQNGRLGPGDFAAEIS